MKLLKIAPIVFLVVLVNTAYSQAPSLQKRGSKITAGRYQCETDQQYAGRYLIQKKCFTHAKQCDQLAH